MNDSSMDISEAKISALIVVGETGMVESKLVQHSRLEVVDVDRVLSDVVTEGIGASVGDSRLHSTPSHPHCETSWVVVSAVICGGEFAL